MEPKIKIRKTLQKFWSEIWILKKYSKKLEWNFKTEKTLRIAGAKAENPKTTQPKQTVNELSWTISASHSSIY